MIAGVLPLLLLFIFGFGVTLDLRRVPIAVVIEWPSPEADSFLDSFRHSPYFDVRFAATARPSSTTWSREGSRELSCWRPTSAIGSAAARRRRFRCSSTAATRTPLGW